MPREVVGLSSRAPFTDNPTWKLQDIDRSRNGPGDGMTECSVLVPLIGFNHKDCYRYPYSAKSHVLSIPVYNAGPTSEAYIHLHDSEKGYLASESD